MASQQPQLQTTETKNLTVAQINLSRRIKQALGAMQAFEQRNKGTPLMGVGTARSDEEGKGSSSSSKPDEEYENAEKNLKNLNLN